MERENVIAEHYRRLFCPTMQGPINSIASDQLPRLTSAGLLSIWLVNRVRIGHQLGLDESERWFLGSEDAGLTPEIGSGKVAEVERLLRDFPVGTDLDELLPYLLEALAGTGLPQARDRGARWAEKRRTGVFYTPSDVSDFIARESIKSLSISRLPLCLDPACGTGVFLRSALDVLYQQGQSSRLEIASHLYGIDISPIAVQSASFVLLSRCLSELHPAPAPQVIWSGIRSNFAVEDATTLSLRAGAGDLFTKAKQIDQYFPSAAHGFDLIIGNPPYSSLQPDDASPIRSHIFATAPTTGSGPIYPLFVEMMWKFANPSEASAGMVVPLSIAYNAGKSHRLLRREMERAGSSWRFHFFDRTPDSLFGDDVKTRNAILLMERRQGGKLAVRTSHLHRWNIRNRPQLFDALPSIELADTHFSNMIPKLGSALEEQVWEQLKEEKLALGEVWVTAPDAVESVLSEESPFDVFHYSTAYNWLPVMRRIPRSIDANGARVIPNSLKRIRSDSTLEAWFTFGVLSSRLAYWLWRVTGDGFHLTQRFLASLPFHPSQFSEDAMVAICTLASHLWQEMEIRPTIAKNGGVTTGNFSPVGSEHLVAELDRILVEERRLPAEFVPFLENYVEEIIIAGRNDTTAKRVGIGGSAS